MKRFSTGLAVSLLTSTLAFAGSSPGGSPWYVVASAGYSSGWSADRHFEFGTILPPGTVGPGDVALIQTVSTSSMPIAALAVGYAWPRKHGFELHAELEGVYQPQKFEITTVQSPVFFSSVPGLIHTSKEDDFGCLLNIGGVFSETKFKPMLMVGLGSNTSKAANTSTLWQAKAGLSWVVTNAVSLTVEARYLSVLDYTISDNSFGPYSIGNRYDFGNCDSVSGTIGVRITF